MTTAGSRCTFTRNRGKRSSAWRRRPRQSISGWCCSTLTRNAEDFGIDVEANYGRVSGLHRQKEILKDDLTLSFWPLGVAAAVRGGADGGLCQGYGALRRCQRRGNRHQPVRLDRSPDDR